MEKDLKQNGEVIKASAQTGVETPPRNFVEAGVGKKMTASNGETPPRTFVEWIIRVIWRLSHRTRMIILILALFILSVVGIWSFLPTYLKNNLITRIFHHTSKPEFEQVRPGDSLIFKELLDNQLIERIKDAEEYLATDAVNSKEEALKIYKDVLHKLSSKACRELDQELLEKAKKDEREGFIDDALAKYRVIFNNVLKNHEKRF